MSTRDFFREKAIKKIEKREKLLKELPDKIATLEEELENEYDEEEALTIERKILSLKKLLEKKIKEKSRAEAVKRAVKRRRSRIKNNDLDYMVESLNDRLDNPECISTEDRALELIEEGLSHLTEAYDLLENDFEDEDPCMMALAMSIESADNAMSYFEVGDEQEDD